MHDIPDKNVSRIITAGAYDETVQATWYGLEGSGF